MPPLVSVCIPTFNSARWIAESLGSALAQDYPDTEILIVDNASTDATAYLSRELGGERVRVLVNERNVGPVRNFNRCLQAAAGEFVQLLMSDDLLTPDCCRTLAGVLEAHPAMGMAFCTRAIELEDPEDPVGQEWARLYGRLHGEWDDLRSVNPAGELFRQYLRCGFRVNWVGEPTCVMLRRSCLDRIGWFNDRLHQGVDFELWARLMFYHEVGFVDRDLCTVRYQYSSGTFANHHSNRPWLDVLWLIEGLLAHDEIRSRWGSRVACLRWKETARVVRALYRRRRAGLPVDPAAHAGSLRDYLAYRLTPRARRPELHRST